MTNDDPARRTRDTRSATPSSVRQVNRSIILNLVRQHQPISRADLSERTGIFRSSISAIVDELVEDKLVVERRAVPKSRGRVPVHLFLNPDGFRVLGVSIRPFHTLVGDSSLPGNITAKLSFPTPRHPKTLVKLLGKAIERIRSENDSPFQGVGISVPGLVHADTGQILMAPSLPRYAGFSISAGRKRVGRRPRGRGERLQHRRAGGAVAE